MTLVLEEARQIKSAPRPTISTLVTIKVKLADLLPLTVIIIGVILTFIWTGGLFWFLASLIEL